MTDRDISDIATTVLRQHDRGTTFLGAEIASDIDFGGNPVVRVTARYDRQVHDADPLAAMHLIRRELLKRGDERLVYLTNRYDDEEALADEDVS